MLALIEQLSNDLEAEQIKAGLLLLDTLPEHAAAQLVDDPSALRPAQ